MAISTVHTDPWGQKRPFCAVLSVSWLRRGSSVDVTWHAQLRASQIHGWPALIMVWGTYCSTQAMVMARIIRAIVMFSICLPCMFFIWLICLTHSQFDRLGEGQRSGWKVPVLLASQGVLHLLGQQVLGFKIPSGRRLQ